MKSTWPLTFFDYFGLVHWTPIIKLIFESPNSGLLYPNLPYIIDQHDGQTIKLTEHLPIMRYLARKHGLYPKTEQELVIAEQTESFVWDVSVFYSFLQFSSFKMSLLPNSS